MRDEDSFARQVRQRQSLVFDTYVGAKKALPYPILVERTGVPKSTWESYAAGVAMPLHNVLRILPLLPREGANALIDMSDLRLVPATAPKTDWLAIGQRACKFSAKVLEYQASDDFIDHTEDADLSNDLRALIGASPGDEA